MLEKPAKLRGHLLYLADLGGDPEAVLSGSGVAFSAVDRLEPMSTAKLSELFDLLARRTRPDFAICAGQATRFQYMGMLGYRLLNCATLREMLDLWSRYSVVIGYPLESALRVEGGRWRLEFWPRYSLSDLALRFCMESTIAGTPAGIRSLTGHQVGLLQYGFPFPRPRDSGRYDRLSGVPVVFDQPVGSVMGREADLGLRLTATDSEAQAISENYCRTTLAGIQRNLTTAQRIRTLLVSSHGEYPTAARAAAVLGCAQRTLQRQLAADGYSYHTLVDEFRCQEAQVLLRQGVEIKIVAYRLGFRDVGSLRRAFRQWTGHTVTDWRKLHAFSSGALVATPDARIGDRHTG